MALIKEKDGRIFGLQRLISLIQGPNSTTAAALLNLTSSGTFPAPDNLSNNSSFSDTNIGSGLFNSKLTSGGLISSSNNYSSTPGIIITLTFNSGT